MSAVNLESVLPGFVRRHVETTLSRPTLHPSQRPRRREFTFHGAAIESNFNLDAAAPRKMNAQAATAIEVIQPTASFSGLVFVFDVKHRIVVGVAGSDELRLQIRKRLVVAKLQVFDVIQALALVKDVDDPHGSHSD
jgi:hypothetical protein